MTTIDELGLEERLETLYGAAAILEHMTNTRGTNIETDEYNVKD